MPKKEHSVPTVVIFKLLSLSSVTTPVLSKLMVLKSSSLDSVGFFKTSNFSCDSLLNPTISLNFAICINLSNLQNITVLNSQHNFDILGYLYYNKMQLAAIPHQVASSGGRAWQVTGSQRAEVAVGQNREAVVLSGSYPAIPGKLSVYCKCREFNPPPPQKKKKKKKKKQKRQILFK